jgi:preprotein translocase subunit YajC
MTYTTDSLLFVAQAAPGASPNAGVMNMIFIGLMFAAMWFLIIAPQRKKQKEHAKLIAELDTGDEILTAGGIYGEITNKKEDRFVVRIADGVKIEVSKSFVQSVVNKSGSGKN